jgi:hypothetical protein
MSPGRRNAPGPTPPSAALRPPPVSDGVRAAHRVPTRRPTFGPTAPALLAVPAPAPKHLGGDGRLDKDHGASCRMAVPVSSAQRRVGFRLRRLRAQSGPLHHAPERMVLSVLPAVPVSGCPEQGRSRGAEALRIPASHWTPTSQLCASESSAVLEESSAAGDSSARSARWARALRGSATPRIARDFLGPKPDWSLVPDLQPKEASSPVIAERPSLRPKTSWRSLKARLVDLGKPKYRRRAPPLQATGMAFGARVLHPLA